MLDYKKWYYETAEKAGSCKVHETMPVSYTHLSWQWAYKKKFEDAGLTALLGCGFDPGVTQAYCCLLYTSRCV